MRAIAKLREPASLAEHRETPHADYDNYTDKDTLRRRLAEEQRGLCCFCCGRIAADPNRMKIAHWMPQTPHPEHQLDYWNLLGACLGNEGQPKKNQHCDTRQGNDLLSRNPAKPEDRIEDLIQFLPDGTITSQDPTLARELGQKRPDGDFEEGVLNLNLAFLRNNRRETLAAFTRGLQKRGQLSREMLERLIAKWRGDSPGELEPYSPVIVYWLRKRLSRA